MTPSHVLDFLRATFGSEGHAVLTSSQEKFAAERGAFIMTYLLM